MNRRLLWAAALMCAIATVSMAAVGQSFPLGLIPSPAPSSEPLDVYVWTLDARVLIGAPITIYVSSTAPAYLYVFDLQPDGIVRMIYPNAFSTGDAPIVGGYTLPDRAYLLLATPPAGVEELLVFGADRPLPIPVGSPSQPFPVIAQSAAGAIDQIVQLLGTLGSSARWAVGWHAFEIVAPNAPAVQTSSIELPRPPEPPSSGGRPGDAWSWTPAGWRYGIPDAGWYWYVGVEGQWHLCWAGLMSPGD